MSDRPHRNRPWPTLSCRLSWPFLVAAMAATLLGGAPSAAQPTESAPLPAPEPSRLVRIATGHAPPFVFVRDGAYSGFSIELWDMVAQRLRLETRFVDLGPRSDEAQIEAVRLGLADAAISDIVMTPAREHRVDFSVAYYDSGLQIAVHPDGDDVGWLSAFHALSLDDLRGFAIGAGLTVLLLAHVLWLVERRHHPRYQRGYLPGIAEGLWGVLLIIATGEHGDRETPRIVKRLTIAGMWLLGVVLIAQFTATVTSALTVRQLQSSVRGPNDLPGKSIAAVSGSVAAEWLRGQGLPFRTFTTAEEARRLLRSGEAQAIVDDSPTLRYYARVFGPEEVIVVGPIFRPERFGIALPPNSPLRKSVNAALLTLYADGTYEEIHQRWFAGTQ